MATEENDIKDERLEHQEEAGDDEVRLLACAAGAKARSLILRSCLLLLHDDFCEILRAESF